MGLWKKIFTCATAAAAFMSSAWNPVRANAQAAQSWTVVPPLISNGGEGRQFVVDLDGDGHDEILLIGKPSHWHWPATSDALTVLGGAQAPAQGLRRIYSRIDAEANWFFRISEVGGFEGSSILAVGSGVTRVLRGKTLSPAATFPSCPWYSVYAAGDLIGDGSLQVLGVSGGWEIRDIRTCDVLRSLSGIDGAVSLAQLDADRALEIIVEGSPLRVIDANTSAVEWAYPSGGHDVSVGTAAHDAGRFVFKTYTGEVVEVDGNPLHVARTIPAPGPIEPNYRYQLADVDGDGRSELLRWQSFGREIQVLDATTLQQRFVLNGSSTDSLYLAAHLSDATYNTLVSVARPNVPDPRSDIAAIDGTIGAVEQLQLVEGPSFSRLAVGDVDGDGHDEVVAASTTNDQDLIRILDRESGDEKAVMRISHHADRGFLAPVQAIALARVSASQPPKIFVENEGSILVIDGVSRQVLYSLAIQNPALDLIHVSTLRTGDIDGDGKEELLVGAAAGFFVVDPYTSRIKWSIPFEEAISDVQMMPAGNGKQDVLVFTAIHAYRVDSVSHNLRWTHSFDRAGSSGVIGVYVAQSASGPAVAVGLTDALQVLDAATGAELHTWEQVGTPTFARGITFVAAPSGRLDRLVLGSDGIRIFDGSKGIELAWPPAISMPIGAEAGSGNNAFIVADPRSGRHAAVMGSDGGVSSFYIVDRDGIFGDGFE